MTFTLKLDDTDNEEDLFVFVFLYCLLYNVHTIGKTSLKITHNG